MCSKNLFNGAKLNNEIISVIIPIFNSQKVLVKCIEALRKQSYGQLEIIFVDDGSTDGSYNLLKKAKEQDNRIKVVRQENKGVSAARNLGILNASGKYIMFCDDDDLPLSDWCLKMYLAIEDHPDAWIACGINVCDEEGNIIYKHEAKGNILDISEYFHVFKSGLSGSVWNKIYRTSIIKENQLLFDTNYKRGEDVLFNIQYYRMCSEIVVVEECLYNYYRYISRKTLTNHVYVDEMNLFEALYFKRLDVISEKDIYEYKKHYWHLYWQELIKVMYGKNKTSVMKKIGICQNIINGEIFQELLKKYGKKEMDKYSYFSLRYRIFLFYLFIQLGHRIKRGSSA